MGGSIGTTRSDDPYQTPVEVVAEPTPDEIRFWEAVYAATASSRVFDDSNKKWPGEWADHAVKERRKRFGVR